MKILKTVKVNDMAKIAILGFGTIGKGVFDVIETNFDTVAKNAGEKIEVAKVVDIRDLSETKAAKIATKNFDDVVNDSSISLVVECMGGHTLAYEFTKKALMAKKNVVTSNKEVVCCYGDELMKLAYENGVSYLFEASVGGGIPIIHPMKNCLSANKINSISGILNGTTNFMLTMMNTTGAGFDEALKKAQELGYAEQDPTADVDGFDAARKIAILTSIAVGSHIALEDVSSIEGIRKITAEDVAFAAKADMSIKLLARSVTENGKACVYVAPHLVKNSDPLAAVSDVFNAVSVECNMLGRALFYGKGAGSLPTASAVVSDVIEAVKSNAEKPVWEERKEGVTLSVEKLETQFFVRVCGSGNELYKKIADTFDKPLVLSNENGKTVAFITGKMTQGKLNEKLKALELSDASVIRVL